MNKTYWFALLLTIVCINSVIAIQQTSFDTALKGLPQVVHYSRHDFNADPQFWAVCEDNDGVLYFGNNDGAIIFDGEQWQKSSIT